MGHPSESSRARRRIAFLNPDSMGDLVLREPLFSAAAAEGHSLSLVVKPGFVELAGRLAPDANVVPLPTDAYAPSESTAAFHVAQVVEELRELQVDMAVIAPFQRTRFDERVIEGLVGVESVGFAGPRYPAATPAAQDPSWVGRLARAVAADQDELEWLKNHRLAEAVVGHPVDWRRPHMSATPQDIGDARRLLDSCGITWPTFHVACLGTSNRLSGRSWPADRWAAVLRHAARRHGWRFVLIGTPDEREGNKGIIESLGGEGAVFIDRAPELGALVGLLELSAGYVGRDSGPMHLAAAIGRPVLSVTGGGTWPRFVPLAPLGAMFSMEVPCSGCGWFCHLDEFYCVTNLPVEPVLAAVDAIVEGASHEMAVLALPRDERLADRMERIAASNGRSHMWLLHQAGLRETARSEKVAGVDAGGTRPRVFLGLPFYGAGNIGDDLALAGFLEAWERLGNPADLVAAIPFPVASQRRRFPAIEWLSDEPHAREAAIRDCDAWLGLGGSPFQTDCGPWMLDCLTHDSTACRRHGRPMVFLGTGVNDRSSLGDRRARDVLSQASYLWMRDADCAEWIAGIVGGDKVACAADCAHVMLSQQPVVRPEARRLGWVMPFEDPSRCANDAVERAIAGLSEWRHDWLVQDVRCLPGGERWRHRQLGSEFRRKVRLCVPDYDAFTAQGLLAAWPVGEAMVSSRYHALLVGAWRGSRLVAVHRNDKLAAAARSLGCVVLERVDHADRLRAAVDAAMPVDRRLLETLAASAFEACRAFAERFLPKEHRVAVRPGPAGHVEFGPGLEGGGWHEPEREGFSWFRWMGGQRSAWIDVVVPPGGASRLRCDVAHVASEGIVRGVRLLLDGAPLAVGIRQGERGWAIDAEFSPLAGGTVARVEFVSDEAIRPCDANPSTSDTRPLAIAVRAVELAPAEGHG